MTDLRPTSNQEMLAHLKSPNKLDEYTGDEVVWKRLNVGSFCAALLNCPSHTAKATIDPFTSDLSKIVYKQGYLYIGLKRDYLCPQYE